MRVVVTGASGFIGGYVCESLRKGGHIVVEVSSRRPLNALTRPSQEHFVADLSIEGSLAGLLGSRIDALVHLAARLPGTFIGSEAERTAAINRRIDANVIAACLAQHASLVYASTASVYGFAGREVKSETADPRPVGPYAEAKLQGERLAAETLRPAGLPLTVLRINAPYGPGQRVRTVLRLFIERALAGLPILYHGTGSREQDFTHVEDVAEAIAVAAIGRISGIYNIAGGKPVSMKDLAGLVVRTVPGCASVVAPSGQPDPQEGATARFDIARAQEIGWQPRIALDVGISGWAADLARPVQGVT